MLCFYLNSYVYTSPILNNRNYNREIDPTSLYKGVQIDFLRRSTSLRSVRNKVEGDRKLI